MNKKANKKTAVIIMLLLLGCTGIFHAWRAYDVQPPALLRLHVVANSNTFYDQDLKYQVKDRIVREMSASFQTATNSEQARAIAASARGKIERIAQDEIRRRGYDYPVRVEIGTYYFPVKTYTIHEGRRTANLTMSPGRYEAVRVLIGNGQGANWWCVLYPPLCFTDLSQALPPAAVTPTASWERLVTAANRETSGSLNEPGNTAGVPGVPKEQINSAPSDNEPGGQPKIEYRFRIVEWWQKIFR
ncbi:MAG: stage II sporulation protein R [Firmicutes bacterium]|nr:stage II sporulation protein R [Bacillota bacterium]